MELRRPYEAGVYMVVWPGICLPVYHGGYTAPCTTLGTPSHHTRYTYEHCTPGSRGVERRPWALGRPFSLGGRGSLRRGLPFS